jgi:hypothetical protein
MKRQSLVEKSGLHAMLSTVLASLKYTTQTRPDPSGVLRPGLTNTCVPDQVNSCM